MKTNCKLQYLKSYIAKSRSIISLLLIMAVSAVGFDAFAQSRSDTTSRSSNPSRSTRSPRLIQYDDYSMTPDSPHKPTMRGFLVKLHGDNGVSIIDTDGNILSRNFTPVVNSEGEVHVNVRTTPVIGNIFCIVRYKEINGNSRRSVTVYRNPENPKPIHGLTDLYDANIINPNLFPICRYGEHIKFVDSYGNEKFTVMPIDGKEPKSVEPMGVNGIIFVEVEYDLKTNDYVDENGRKHKAIISSIIKEGAIDTTGKWVIKPEWDRLAQQMEGTIAGYKGEAWYKVTPGGKAEPDNRFEKFNMRFNWIKAPYIVESFRENGKYIYNIYDLKQNYITTIDNANSIRYNPLHPNILLVRRDFASGKDSYYNLIDIKRNNAIITKNYSDMEALPNGNYWGSTDVKYSKEYYNYKSWYVKYNGVATPLPDNCNFPLRKPGMALYYDTNIHYFIVNGYSKSKLGYLCDFSGKRIGNISFDQFYSLSWQAYPVNSSYFQKYILGSDDY